MVEDTQPCNVFEIFDLTCKIYGRIPADVLFFHVLFSHNFMIIKFNRALSLTKLSNHIMV